MAPNSPTLNLVFALFYDLMFSKIPGAGDYLQPYGNLTLKAILDEKIPLTDEFLVSPSSVAFIETCILRSVFPNSDKANEDWLQSSNFTNHRISFHANNPQFRDELHSILSFWYKAFPVQRSSRKRASAAAFNAAAVAPDPQDMHLRYPDRASIETNASFLQDLNDLDGGEASAAARPPFIPSYYH